MAKYTPPERTPIAVVFKKKYGKKPVLKVFKDHRCPDRILSTRSPVLPKDCEVLDVGVGSRFESIYRKKYKL